jgi:hypothetical protein
MTAVGYSLLSRKVPGGVRLAPNWRHSNRNVGFDSDFVRFCEA